MRPAHRDVSANCEIGLQHRLKHLHVSLSFRFNSEWRALRLRAAGIRVKLPAMMECAINNNKPVSDTTTHQIRQLLHTALRYQLLQCHGSGRRPSACVRFQGSPCVGLFVLEKVALGQVLLSVLLGFPYQLSFHKCSTLIYPSSGGCTMGPLQEALALRPTWTNDAARIHNKAAYVHIMRHWGTFVCWHCEPLSHGHTVHTASWAHVTRCNMSLLLGPVFTFLCKTSLYAHVHLSDVSATHNVTFAPR
jgi:hypothetical protein